MRTLSVFSLFVKINSSQIFSLPFALLRILALYAAMSSGCLANASARRSSSASAAGRTASGTWAR